MEASMRVGAVNVFEDNVGAIKSAVNKHARRSIKHIDVKHRLIGNAYDAGKIRVVYQRTEDQYTSQAAGLAEIYKHARTVFHTVYCDSNVWVYCERCACFSWEWSVIIKLNGLEG